MLRITLPLLLLLCTIKISTQNNPVFIDEEGIMRYTDSKAEASFFGINYTTPFAYGYRSHKALDKDLKTAMLEDIAHFEKLEFNAFRVHVWDVEISDTLGNLLENEHLDLFDFLIFELQKRNIKTLITPIAYWGNGYPQRDEKTPGFSTKYGKGRVNIEEEGIKAQENFLTQFFRHKNPYTQKTYMEDASVIAMEINNEPSHSGPKEEITAYINRMIKAVKSTGWTKPIFYNISQNPWCADAVARSNAEGFSFQWYPTGLVANKTLQGNYLQNVDHYRINFGDTIPEFKNKALMVYEFDCGDVYNSTMYPFMARSFREAGMQWATQFAYDPLATAYANTEYQTHFVNLAYTPGKALSLMIAGKVFHETGRLQTFKDYPSDTVFGNFIVSPTSDCAVYNSFEQFIHTNNTTINPRSLVDLKKVAGIGNSPLIQYSGSGAYFLRKIDQGIWELEVMPDAIVVDDVFGRASPEREVVRINWRAHDMKIQLPDLSHNFNILAAKNNNYESFTTAEIGKFNIEPGKYLLVKAGQSTPETEAGLYVAPQSVFTAIKVYHLPPVQAIQGVPLNIEATIAGLNDNAEVSLLLNAGPWASRRIPMTEVKPYVYQATIPETIINPGMLTYRISVSDGEESLLMPGNIKKEVTDWDFYEVRNYEVPVYHPGAPFSLFDAFTDRNDVTFYNQRWRENNFSTVTTMHPNEWALVMKLRNNLPENEMGIQKYFGGNSFASFNQAHNYEKASIKVINRGSSLVTFRLILIDRYSNAFSVPVSVRPEDEIQIIEIPLEKFRNGKSVQLPRPYPGFQDLYHETPAEAQMNVADLEKMQVIISADENNSIEFKTLEILSISLK